MGQEMNLNIKNIALGEDTVRLKIYVNSGSRIAYAHVHENEYTSLQAGMEMVRKYGGKLVTLVHSPGDSRNRNVKFKFRNTIYQFDPNRIYTEDKQVLLKNINVVKGKGIVDAEVIKMVSDLADSIWTELMDYPLIVALHNNKNVPAEIKTRWIFWKRIEPESYNITSYVKKFDKTSDSNLSCSDIYINPAMNNSEFFIVTDSIDFVNIFKKKYSVVQQNRQPVDDGSMSVFASKSGKRYINTETKLGRIKEQSEMLEIIQTY